MEGPEISQINPNLPWSSNKTDRHPYSSHVLLFQVLLQLHLLIGGQLAFFCHFFIRRRCIKIGNGWWDVFMNAWSSGWSIVRSWGSCWNWTYYFSFNWVLWGRWASLNKWKIFSRYFLIHMLQTLFVLMLITLLRIYHIKSTYHDFPTSLVGWIGFHCFEFSIIVGLFKNFLIRFNRHPF